MTHVPRRKTVDLNSAEAALARAKASLAGAQTSFHVLVRSIVDQLPDPRRTRDVGRMLDDIARRRLYRLVGHANLDDFLRDSLGISRATAYRLRRIARAPGPDQIPQRGKMRAYEAARSAETRSRSRRSRS